MVDTPFIAPAYKNPKRLFLIDGIGALVSALMLGIVLVRYESFFGMPGSALILLAAAPIGFALYDVVSYLTASQHTGILLKGISLLNVGYCGFSIALLTRHADQLTTWGWLYFIGELLIVLTLAGIEWNAAKRLDA